MIPLLLLCLQIVPDIEPAWTLEGFDAPESALVLDDGSLLVSNVTGDGGARDGTGYISRVSPDGEWLDRSWATGLDAPKGLAVANGILHVADIDRVARFDVDSGEALPPIRIGRAQFLNDVASLDGEGVLVTDSAAGRIFKVSAHRTEIWFESDAVSGLNGLWVEPGRVLVIAMDGHVYAIDRETRALTTLASGVGRGDGIAGLTGGGYLLSAWPGQIFYWAGGETSPVELHDSRAIPVYQNDLSVSGDRLYVPNWEPGSLTAWSIGESTGN